MGLVGEERHPEVVLFLEFLLRRDRVGGNPQNFRPGLAEFGAKRRKINRFLGAAGGVGLWVEVNDELAAFEVGERHAGAAVAG